MVGSLLLTAGCVALALGAFVGGRAVLADRLDQADTLAPAPLTSVQVAYLHLQSEFRVTRTFAGQFEAPQTTSLGFEEGGKIAAIFVNEGDTVSAGDVIARLDTRLLAAERNRLLASREAVAARAELARRTNERQLELQGRGFASNQAVDDTSLTLVQLNAQMAEIDAAVAILDVRVSKADLIAPFDGTIANRVLDIGAVAGAGAPVLTLLERGPVLFRAGLDPDQVQGLRTDAKITVRISGVDHTAQLERTAPELDLMTRTQTTFFSVDDVAPPSGTAAEAVVHMTRSTKTPGAWIPLTALRNGPQGTWQVLTATETDGNFKVTRAAVELIHIEADQAFVTGTLADGQAYVTGGLHRVVPGEHITPIFPNTMVSS